MNKFRNFDVCILLLLALVICIGLLFTTPINSAKGLIVVAVALAAVLALEGLRKW